MVRRNPYSQNQRTQDGTQSNQNAWFDFQPLSLTEILPEAQVTSTNAPGDPTTNPTTDRPLPEVPVAPMSIPSASTRSKPWELGEADGETFNSSLRMIPPGDPFEDYRVPPATPAPPPPDPTKPEAEYEKEKVVKEEKTTPPLLPIVFQADVIASESYNFRASTSKYPSDRLGKISDHHFPEAFSLSISAIHSNTVFAYSDTLENLLNSKLIQSAEMFEKMFRGDDAADNNRIESRTDRVFTLLMNWWKTGRPLMLKTSYAPYGFRDPDGEITPFTIESLTLPKNKNMGDAMSINMVVREMRTVVLPVTTTVSYDAAPPAPTEKSEQSNDGTEGDKEDEDAPKECELLTGFDETNQKFYYYSAEQRSKTGCVKVKGPAGSSYEFLTKDQLKRMSKKNL